MGRLIPVWSITRRIHSRTVTTCLMRQRYAGRVASKIWRQCKSFHVLSALGFQHCGLDNSTRLLPFPLLQLMEKLDFMFTCFFSLEMLLKVAALGFVAGENTYLKDAWNQLDAVVVLTSWLPYILHAAGTGTAHWRVSPVYLYPLCPCQKHCGTHVVWWRMMAGTRIFRTFRLLRPMRSISRFPGLRRLVTTILMAVPQLQVSSCRQHTFSPPAPQAAVPHPNSLTSNLYAPQSR